MTKPNLLLSHSTVHFNKFSVFELVQNFPRTVVRPCAGRYLNGLVFYVHSGSETSASFAAARGFFFAQKKVSTLHGQRYIPPLLQHQLSKSAIFSCILDTYGMALNRALIRKFYALLHIFAMVQWGDKIFEGATICLRISAFKLFSSFFYTLIFFKRCFIPS